MKTVVKALVSNPQGKLLFLYRGMTHPHFPGHLDLPGGEVEEGEDIVDAVIREIKEETGIAVRSEQVTECFVIKYPNVIHILYDALIDSSKPEINLSWEHMRYQWLDKQDILKRGIDSSMDRYYVDVFKYLSKKV